MRQFSELQRTHTCGELSLADAGKIITLNGWVHGRRDHGGLIFIDLRDRYGVTQVVFRPETVSADILKTAGKLGYEFVVSASGKVVPRPDGMKNPDMVTGEIEIEATELTILSESATPPFLIEDDPDASEELRLTYRYLDLRREPLKNNMILRHRFVKSIRDHLDSEGFLEIETPMLIRSTPEGARDYVVPSRVSPGRFYALPQSPQLFKQILMISGFDKYFQMARCLRDEDLRADRQPEHTQIDMEMSFVTVDDIFSTVERMMTYGFKKTIDADINTPFPRYSYDDVMNRYGSDKPDLRITLELVDLSEAVRECGFKVFSDTVKSGGVVKGLTIPGKADLSRKQVSEIEETAKSLGAKGLAYFGRTDEKVKSPVAKFLDQSEMDRILEAAGVNVGDMLFTVADTRTIANKVLGGLRTQLGRRFEIVDNARWNFLWVMDFPLFEYNPDEKRYDAMHNIVTSPKEADIPLLDAGFDQSVEELGGDHPWGKILANQYDLVLNGTEIASGGIRNHRRDIQQKILNVLGMNDSEAEERFGFLLKALTFGAPPHGGIAPGLDRIVAIMCGSTSIRDVIAFPKTTAAQSLMDAAPSTIDPKQLRELKLRVVDDDK
ncbi:MAG: aspartate--tRNA ligase [Candidatus Zixiibacteriota bacterium]